MWENGIVPAAKRNLIPPQNLFCCSAGIWNMQYWTQYFSRSYWKVCKI